MRKTKSKGRGKKTMSNPETGEANAETKAEDVKVDTTKTDELQNGGKATEEDESFDRFLRLEARVENIVKRNHLLEADR